MPPRSLVPLCALTVPPLMVVLQVLVVDKDGGLLYSRGVAASGDRALYTVRLRLSLPCPPGPESSTFPVINPGRGTTSVGKDSLRILVRHLPLSSRIVHLS